MMKGDKVVPLVTEVHAGEHLFVLLAPFPFLTEAKEAAGKMVFYLKIVPFAGRESSQCQLSGGGTS